VTRNVTPERWSRVESVLHAALERSADERAAFLDRACGGDAELRRDVASLLEAHERSGAIDRISAEVISPLIAHLESPDVEGKQRTLARYDMLERLGGGGMGVLYTARDTRLHRTVALKFLLPQLGADQSAKQRFMLEARAAAALDHPNVCTIHEIGETTDGQLFIAMPFYEGETLKSRISRGPLPIDEALAIALQIARGLAKAHQHGIVHRDVKPSNVMVTADGAVKILDFGIAKLADLTLTGGGAFLGTVAYMSPEQTRGEAVDQRTDVWSLGAVLYEMLTGRKAFSGDDADRVRGAIVGANPEPITALRPDVPPALERVVTRALAKQHEARYGSMRELEHDLRALGASDSEPAAGAARALPERSRPGSASTPPRRRRLGALLLALTAVALPLIFAANWVRGRGGDSAPALDAAKIVVVPFRVTGVDSSLRYLGEGVVDLLAAKLTGESGPRAVDPHTAISAWNRVTAGREGTAEDAREVARSAGAGEALLGTIIGVPGNRLTITASVIPSGGGAPRPTEMVTGLADDYVELLDQLATRLLARQAGLTEQTLGALTSQSNPAVRAYLQGRYDHRRGHDTEAIEHFARALETDSTFALAALDLAVATNQLLAMCASGRVVYQVPGYRSPQPQSDRRRFAEAVRVAWQYRAKLSARDRPLLEALRGVRCPRPSSAREMLAALQRAEDAAPDRAETHYLIGTLLLNQGPAVGEADSRERAAAEFNRARALDSKYLAPVAQLVDAAAFDGDTAQLRKVGALYLSRDSIGPAADYVRWRVAAGLRDEASLRLIRSRFDSLGTATLQRILQASQMTGVALEDADRAITLMLGRAADPAERSATLFVASTVALNRGRPSRAASLLRQRRQVDPRDLAYWTTTAMAALFWDGDSAAGRAAARERAARIARDTLGPPREALAERGDLARHVAQQGLWDLLHGDTTRAAAAVRWLQVRHPLGAVFVDALLATQARRPDAQMLRARLDSVALEGCCPGDLARWLNLVIARAYEAAGRDADALRAVRRGVWHYPPQLLSTYLREEGQLAARLGDTTGAIRAYRHYLLLRSDPEPSLRPTVDSVRAELARLQRGGQ
jgi:tetratricopeptide (TPR) repeat protein